MNFLETRDPFNYSGALVKARVLQQRVVVCLLCFPLMARAYLDPGAGSYLFQLLLGGLFGLLFCIKTFWRQIRGFFSNLFSQ